MTIYPAYADESDYIRFAGIDGLDGEVHAKTENTLVVKVKGYSYASSDRLARGKDKRIYVPLTYYVYNINKCEDAGSGLTRYELSRLIYFGK